MLISPKPLLVVNTPLHTRPILNLHTSFLTQRSGDALRLHPSNYACNQVLDLGLSQGMGLHVGSEAVMP